MQDFEKEKLAAIMDIVYRTAEPEWKGAREAKCHACPKCGSIAKCGSDPHPAGEGIFESEWAEALVKFAIALVGKPKVKDIANAELRKPVPKLWKK